MDGSARTPVHLWIVGLAATVWNAFLAYDYVMTQMRDAAWLASFTQDWRDYFASFPAWMDAAWAIGVWAALAGSLLLLARSRHAVLAFTLSLAGLLVGALYQYALTTHPAPTRSAFMVAIYVAMWAIAIAFFVYARRMRAKGVLR